MKGGDFTADNEIISCWIKRALSYLAIAGAAFIVIGIVCLIHFLCIDTNTTIDVWIMLSIVR